MTTGQAIRQIREAVGESQQKFSNRFCLSFMTISRWENGQFSPTSEHLSMLAELGIDLGLSEAVKALILAVSQEALKAVQCLPRDMAKEAARMILATLEEEETT